MNLISTSSMSDVKRLPLALTSRRVDSVHLQPDSWTTLKQGEVGDCYFLSALDSLAHQRPHDVEALMHASGKAYRVQFHETRAVRAVGTEVARGVTADGPWACVLESAWQKVKGNLKANGQVDEPGGNPAEAIRALTGRRTRTVELHSWNGREVIAEMRTHMAQGGIAVAATRRACKGFLPSHAYTVLAVDENDNVIVRNPWGSGPYPPSRAAGYAEQPMGPGTFALDPSTFTKRFPDVYYEVRARRERVTSAS